MRKPGHRAGLLLACALSCGSSAEAGETIAYGYDSLGRLVRVERTGTVNSGVNARYSYDSADNRTNVTVSGAPTAAGGSFEAPEVEAGYAYRPSGGQATFAGNFGIAGNSSLWGFAAAPDGDQIAFVQSNGTASTITLQIGGLTSGTSYTARFWIAARPGFGTNPVTVAYNGVSLGTFTPGSAAFTAVTSAPFAATAGTGTLTFTGTASSADLGTGLDGVSLAVAESN